MTASLAAAEILRRAPSIQPRVGVVLGAGLGPVLEGVSDPVVVPYAALPGFPMPTVEGHPGRITMGHLGGMPVALLHGRHHAYEGDDNAGLHTFIRAIRQIGCDTVILTGAVGSLDPALAPGALMVVEDHINLMGYNPLVGANERNFGPQFVGLRDAYDPALRATTAAAAAKLGIPLASGVYTGILGPSFETAAEARMIRTLGGTVIGMSIVPETIVARHCGLKVLALTHISHRENELADALDAKGSTIKVKTDAVDRMRRLLTGILQDLNAESVTS